MFLTYPLQYCYLQFDAHMVIAKPRKSGLNKSSEYYARSLVHTECNHDIEEGGSAGKVGKINTAVPLTSGVSNHLPASLAASLLSSL